MSDSSTVASRDRAANGSNRPSVSGSVVLGDNRGWTGPRREPYHQGRAASQTRLQGEHDEAEAGEDSIGDGMGHPGPEGLDLEAGQPNGAFDAAHSTGYPGEDKPAALPSSSSSAPTARKDRTMLEVQRAALDSGYSYACIGAVGCVLLVLVVLAFVAFSLFARDVLYEGTDASSVGIGLFAAGAVLALPCAACVIMPCVGCVLCCQTSIDSSEGRPGLLDATVHQAAAALWVSLVAVVGPLLLIVPMLVLHPRDTREQDLDWQYALWSLFLSQALGWLPLGKLAAEVLGFVPAAGYVWMMVAFSFPLGVFVPALVLEAMGLLAGLLGVAACLVLSYPVALLTNKVLQSMATTFYRGDGRQGAGRSGAAMAVPGASSEDVAGPSRMPEATFSDEERQLDLCCGTCCVGYGALFVAHEQRVQRRVDAQQTVIAVSSPSRPVRPPGATAVCESPLKGLGDTVRQGRVREEDLQALPPHRRLVLRARHLGATVARSGTAGSRRAQMLQKRQARFGHSMEGGDLDGEGEGEGEGAGKGEQVQGVENPVAAGMAKAEHARGMLDRGLSEQMQFLLYSLDAEHPHGKRPPGLYAGSGESAVGQPGQADGGALRPEGGASSQLDDHDGTIGLRASAQAAKESTLLQAILARPKVQSARACMGRVRVALAEAGALADEVQETVEQHPKAVRFVPREFRNAVVGASRACCAAALDLIRGFGPEDCAEWLDRVHGRMLELVEQLGQLTGAGDGAIGASLLDRVEDAIEAAAERGEVEDMERERGRGGGLAGEEEVGEEGGAGTGGDDGVHGDAEDDEDDEEEEEAYRIGEEPGAGQWERGLGQAPEHEHQHQQLGVGGAGPPGERRMSARGTQLSRSSFPSGQQQQQQRRVPAPPPPGPRAPPRSARGRGAGESMQQRMLRTYSRIQERSGGGTPRAGSVGGR